MPSCTASACDILLPPPSSSDSPAPCELGGGALFLVAVSNAPSRAGAHVDASIFLVGLTSAPICAGASVVVGARSRAGRPRPGALDVLPLGARLAMTASSSNSLSCQLVQRCGHGSSQRCTARSSPAFALARPAARFHHGADDIGLALLSFRRAICPLLIFLEPSAGSVRSSVIHALARWPPAVTEPPPCTLLVNTPIAPAPRSNPNTFSIAASWWRGERCNGRRLARAVFRDVGAFRGGRLSSEPRIAGGPVRVSDSRPTARWLLTEVFAPCPLSLIASRACVAWIAVALPIATLHAARR